MRDSLAEDTCTLGLHSLCSFSKEREADAPPSPFQSHREGQGFLQGAGQSQERRNGSSADQRLCTRAEVPKPHSRELCLLGIHPELRCDHLAVRFNWNPLSLIPDGASPFLGPQSPQAFLRTSLVVQWIRICLSMQETMVPSLVQEDPTCLGAFKLMHLSLSAAATEALTPRTCAPQEEPLQ